MPLGLQSSEQLASYWFSNCRRRIFYAYPNGTAPLTGLLSMSESDFTPQPKFEWEEERWQPITTATAQGPAPSGNLNGPFYMQGSAVTPQGSSNGPFTLAAFAVTRVYVADSTSIQEDDVVKIFGVPADATGPTYNALNNIDISGRVTFSSNSVSGAPYIEIAVTLPYPAYGNTNTPLNVTAANAIPILVIGSAYAEGSRSRTGLVQFPYQIYNNTQIFKTPWEMTRTALKEPLIYDKTGAYRDMAKQAGIRHLSQIEYATFFGERGYTTATDPDTGSTVSRRFMGGLRWFLDNWENGTDYGMPNIQNSTDYVGNIYKRVIKMNGATMPKATFNVLMSRLFERTNNSTWEKLCFCGPEYLGMISESYENKTATINMRENGFDGWDFELVQHNTNAGRVYYKQHPLFTSPSLPWMRKSAFYVDLGYIGYRPLLDTDTDIQPLIQLPDADKRKDQWLTECGLEIRFPEAFMYVENLGGITG